MRNDDVQPQSSQKRANLLRLPRGRNASPWTIRLVLIAAIVAVLLAPLWIDPTTLNSIFAVSQTAVPFESEAVSQPTSLRATDDPRLTWTVIGSDADAGGAAGVWGTADLGGTWSVSASSDLTVATLDDLTSHEVEVTFDVALTALPADESVVVGPVLRESADGAAYVPQLQIDSVGSVSVAIDVLEGGARRALELPTPVSGLVLQPGVPLHLRARVTGIDPATVRLRVWSSSEPAEWQASAIDWTGLLQHAGGLGLAWSATLPSQPQFTNFTASSADKGETQ